MTDLLKLLFFSESFTVLLFPSLFLFSSAVSVTVLLPCQSVLLWTVRFWLCSVSLFPVSCVLTSFYLDLCGNRTDECHGASTVAGPFVHWFKQYYIYIYQIIYDAVMQAAGIGGWSSCNITAAHFMSWLKIWTAMKVQLPLNALQFTCYPSSVIALV